ncbi:MAG: hypothetical protein GX443_09535 [Deltaproteobacteria bacterium]|nr:hypothetical protein [Deltaproteobacteria bacterium]
MAARYNPKTLAKTLSYIGYHSPAEFGLFWDMDGSMPWKEFHRALQEDVSLRFVRESHLRELEYLAMELPFTLESPFLHLRDSVSPPHYAVVPCHQERLFFPFSLNQLHFLQKKGLLPAGRFFLPLFGDRDFALRMGKRRDPSPFVLEVFPGKAITKGLTLLKAGESLYLAQAVPPECLVFPRLRESALVGLADRRVPSKKDPPSNTFESPGSFIMDIKHMEENYPVPAKPGGRKHPDAPGWKRNSRKERFKRTL